MTTRTLNLLGALLATVVFILTIVLNVAPYHASLLGFASGGLFGYSILNLIRLHREGTRFTSDHLTKETSR